VDGRSLLDEIAREGARRMLVAAPPEGSTKVFANALSRKQGELETQRLRQDLIATVRWLLQRAHATGANGRVARPSGGSRTG
jgi:hypothetical protein